jgi:hypothetical protein
LDSHSYTGESVRDLTAVEQHNACYLPEPRDGRGPLLGLFPGVTGRLVPAVIHDFFILQVRVCGDLTAVEQHNACYLPEPRDSGDLCLVRYRGRPGRLVPAVIHDFFILQVRVCGDLTAVEQHKCLLLA